MGSGCENAIVESFPSSSGQLPVPVALNAAFSTLFPVIIHDWKKKVNSFFKKAKKNCHLSSSLPPKTAWALPLTD